MLLMKDIVREGNDVLNQKAVDVHLPLSKEDEKTLIEMREYIYNSCDDEIASKYNLRAGVGLAAPQIGISKRMFVIVSPDENGKEHEFVLVNPKIISYSDELTYLESGEGCLSVDREVNGYVHRPRRITVEAYIYQDGKLTKKTFRLKGYLAVVFGHEYDHLNGILFTDRIDKKNPFYVPTNSTKVVFKEPSE